MTDRPTSLRTPDGERDLPPIHTTDAGVRWSMWDRDDGHVVLAWYLPGSPANVTGSYQWPSRDAIPADLDPADVAERAALRGSSDALPGQGHVIRTWPLPGRWEATVARQWGPPTWWVPLLTASRTGRDLTVHVGWLRWAVAVRLHRTGR